jgi:hypothetical protein
MLKFFASLFVALATVTMATADHPQPPVPEGGISFFYQSECQDAQSGLEGMCYVGTDKDGTMYVTFFVKGELAFIRTVVGSTYETIWERHPGEPT